jgi:hypothetical protein
LLVRADRKVSDTASTGNPDEEDSSNALDLHEAEQLMSQPAVRLALERSIAPMRSRLATRMKLCGVARVLAIVVILLAASLTLHNYFADSITMFRFLELFAEVRDPFIFLLPRTALAWISQSFQPMSDADLTAALGVGWETTTAARVNRSADLDFTMFNLSMMGLRALDVMSRQVYVNAYDTGTNSVGLADILVNYQVQRFVCDPVTGALGPETISVVTDDEFRLFYAKLAEFGLEGEHLVEPDLDSCTAFAISRSILDAIHMIGGFVSESYKKHRGRLTPSDAPPDPAGDPSDPAYVHNSWLRAVDSSQLMDVSAVASSGGSDDIVLPLLVVLIPTLIAVVSLPSFIYMTGGLAHERERILGVLASFSDADREKASRKILSSGFASEELVTDLDVATIASRSDPYVLSLFSVVLTIVAILIPLVSAADVDTTMRSIHDHFSLHNLLHIVIAETGRQTLLLGLFAQYEQSSDPRPMFWSAAEARAAIYAGLAEIDLILDLLNPGYNDAARPLSIFAEVDRLRLAEKCVTPEYAKYPHELYKCLSPARMATYFSG